MQTRLGLLLISLLLIACQAPYYPRNAPRVVQGQLDLSRWDFSTQAFIELKGDWLCRGLNEVEECKAPDSVQSIPFTRWRSFDVVQTGRSFHTLYEVVLQLPAEPKQQIYLNVRDVFGAYKLSLVDPDQGTIFFQEQHGIISDEQEQSAPVGGEIWAPLPAETRLKIQLEISSAAASYGLFRPPVITRPENLGEQREKNILQMAMIIGAFTLLGLYSLVLFAQRTQDKGHLIIGLLSLVLALRQMASEQLISKVLGISMASFYIQSDMLFMSYFGSLLLFSIYLFHRVGRLRRFKNWILAGVIGQVLIEAMAIAAQIYQAKVYLGLVFPFGIYLFGLLFMAFYVIFRVKTPDPDVKLVRLSLLLPVFGIIYDSYVAQMNVDWPYIAHYTLLGFILAQSILVGRAFAHSFSENERLLLEVREKEKSRTIFFHNTSHELRTPLNGIIGFLELLIGGRYGQLTDEAGIQLQKCVRLAQSLKNQVNTILDLAKSRKGTLELSNSQFRLVDLIHEAQDLAEGLLLKYKNTRFNLDVETSLHERNWIGDYGKMATILRNLLGNAFKFANPGRVNQVDLLLTIVQDQLLIEVSDTGIGIPQDQQAQVFEEFRQVQGDARRAYEGTGLGLSMVRDLCRLMNARIDLQSAPGIGTRFRITLPEQKTVHMTATPELMENTRLTKISGQRTVAPLLDVAAPGRGRILVVDDNEINCEVLQDLLLGEGYEVSVAHSGAEALQKVAASPPDLMLLDMMMPQMSGEDVLAAMKKDPNLEEIPVILVTARASDDDRIFGLSLGADDYLAKPIQHEELSFRVRNLLKRIETVHRMDAIEERERMAQLGDMMRELSHELKNLFQLGKLDRATIESSSQKTLGLLPLHGAAWDQARGQLIEGQHVDDVDLQSLSFARPESAQNQHLRALRFIVCSLPLPDAARQDLWQRMQDLQADEQENCEQVLTLVRSYQLLEHQADYAAQLVASILDYSRNSQNLGACDAADVWKTLHRLIQPRLKKHRVQIRTTPEALRLPINAAHLLQILLNLVGNAIDAMQSLPPEQRWIQITGDGRDHRRLIVENAGAPIAPALQADLFIRGRTTKGAAGSGLGLFITRKLMQRSAGQITYDGKAPHPRFVLIWKQEGAAHAVVA